MHALVTGCHVHPEEYPARGDSNEMVWSTVERGEWEGEGAGRAEEGAGLGVREVVYTQTFVFLHDIQSSGAV